ncbi:mechanosensitive ion channel family protein [Natranaerofaba carboxydovora]|uniref:mechanosensitive ion channel family protein n=1 Tax=Natranaerofaba carboxydovora TaxID=2742683 RepID=UPI001F13F17E|nr:mechanosensitive ion channel domain-containing protein [Natranaerofaba carboxydovora]UMZ73641.1 Small-conductance mechanosensitive channel [Natranaerofaba carboxydovora]
MDLDSLFEMSISYGSQVLLALIVLIVGLKVIKKITTVASARLVKSSIEESLSSFLTSVISVLLKIVLLITVASMLGVEVTTFVALIASIGFAIGLALQGSLANFAGGVLILTLKPFKVGDYIESAGYAGTVHDIQVFYTILNTPDNKKIIIPNASLSNNSAINYSAYDTRRLDLTLSVGYDTDIEKVREILKDIADKHELIFDDPPPQIVLGEHGDSALVFYYRVWCKAENYWPLLFELNETTKIAFDKEGINIPYPQMDVHLQK